MYKPVEYPVVALLIAAGGSIAVTFMLVTFTVSTYVNAHVQSSSSKDGVNVEYGLYLSQTIPLRMLLVTYSRHRGYCGCLEQVLFHCRADMRCSV